MREQGVKMKAYGEYRYIGFGDILPENDLFERYWLLLFLIFNFRDFMILRVWIHAAIDL